jgi:hypothetical protein
MTEAQKMWRFCTTGLQCCAHPCMWWLPEPDWMENKYTVRPACSSPLTSSTQYPAASRASSDGCADAMACCKVALLWFNEKWHFLNSKSQNSLSLINYLCKIISIYIRSNKYIMKIDFTMNLTTLMWSSKYQYFFSINSIKTKMVESFTCSHNKRRSSNKWWRCYRSRYRLLWYFSKYCWVHVLWR